jgi:hypothetical protein
MLRNKMVERTKREAQAVAVASEEKAVAAALGRRFFLGVAS